MSRAIISATRWAISLADNPSAIIPGRLFNGSWAFLLARRDKKTGSSFFRPPSAAPISKFTLGEERALAETRTIYHEGEHRILRISASEASLRRTSSADRTVTPRRSSARDTAPAILASDSEYERNIFFE